MLQDIPNSSPTSVGFRIYRLSELAAIALSSLVCLCPAALHAGLIQRVDAAVSGSVRTNGAGVVTSCVDRSGYGNNASSLPGTVSFPSVSLSTSGKAGFRLKRPANWDV